MIRSAIIGMGNISRVHVEAIRNHPHAELVGVCDVDPARSNAVEGVPFFARYDEMIRAVRPDCVHLCLPHHLHFPVAREVAAMGCHIFAEKPTALNLAQTEEFSKLETTFDVCICICMQNRMNATTLALLKELKDDKSGAITGVFGAVAWCREQQYYAEKPWRGSMETAGGGVLINQALHTLDLMLYIMNSPVQTVRGCIGRISDYGLDIEDTATARIVFENGGIGLFSATVANFYDRSVQLEVQCENAFFVIDRGCLWKRENTGTRLLTQDTKPINGKACYGDSHSALIHRFYHAIEAGTQDYIHPSETIALMRVIEDIRAG